MDAIPAREKNEKKSCEDCVIAHFGKIESWTNQKEKEIKINWDLWIYFHIQYRVQNGWKLFSAHFHFKMQVLMSPIIDNMEILGDRLAGLTWNFVQNR